MRHSFLTALLIISCSIKESEHKNKGSETGSNQSSRGLNEACNSIPKDYFVKLKFPFTRLDSISETDIDTRKYLKFQACDNFLFNNNRTDIQTYSYISLQDTTDYYSILVFRQMDMENCLFFFSFDKEYKIVDSELLFCVGGGLDRQSDVLIDSRLVNTLSEEKKAIFREKRFISSHKEFYSIVDTTTKSKSIEVGQQKIIEYEIDKSGRFKKLREDSFEKEYTNPKYWYH